MSNENVENRRRAAPWVRAALVLVAVGLIAGGGYLWWTTSGTESTDDAYTDGRAVVIAPQVAGNVIALDIDDNHFVHKGDPLFQIDPRPFLYARDQAQAALLQAEHQEALQRFGAAIAHRNFPAILDEAKAQLANAQAVLFRADADYRRQQHLPGNATTQADIDAAAAAKRQASADVDLATAKLAEAAPVDARIGQAEAQALQATGQVQEAEARLHQAELNLAWTHVAAPQDGWVTKRDVEVGTYVAPGQEVLTLVSPEVWITANFKEAQLDKIRPGQHVRISIDAYPELAVEGHVDSIQLGSGSKFTAFPPENATGNYVKIVQRIPVKIDVDRGLDPTIPLGLGLSVVPTVTVK